MHVVLKPNQVTIWDSWIPITWHVAIGSRGKVCHAGCFISEHIGHAALSNAHKSCAQVQMKTLRPIPLSHSTTTCPASRTWCDASLPM